MKETVKLTQFSHGAGCGCKISPEKLDQILAHVSASSADKRLLVGNKERDDAAVMDLGDGTAIISTTDFFMPIVDDPEQFGKIAATNAISDIYAMGGTPLMAIAILGWPVNVLPAEVAGRVIDGAQKTCTEAGIPLAGGHSIDAPEPIFGLAVTGRVKIENIKKNGGAKAGDILFLTKPLGIGILATAQKRDLLSEEHESKAVETMTQLNSVGERLGEIAGVTAMTDVTGFGLGGHLLEMCHASGTSAMLKYADLPLIDASIHEYIVKGCIPGGTNRNFDSYGEEIKMTTDQRFILCDPQTSGGLLIAADPAAERLVSRILTEAGCLAKPVGKMVEKDDYTIIIA